MNSIQFKQIGIIHSPHKDIKGMPVQPSSAEGIKGTVEVYENYAEGLKDIDGFSHIILLYHLHKVEKSELIVTPFLDTAPRGVFATRAPTRPNPIGLSIVRLKSIEGNVLHIENIDILDGTPLLDIKPYIKEFDHNENVRTGWMKAARGEIESKRSDNRFE